MRTDLAGVILAGLERKAEGADTKRGGTSSRARALRRSLEEG